MVQERCDVRFCVTEETPKLDVISFGSTSATGENRFLDHVRRVHPPFLAWQRKKQTARNYGSVGAHIEFLPPTDRPR